MINIFNLYNIFFNAEKKNILLTVNVDILC